MDIKSYNLHKMCISVNKMIIYYKNILDLY